MGFLFLGSKNTADSDYSHEIKRYLLLGRKAMTNLDTALKSRDITLLPKSMEWKLWLSSSHVWMWEWDHKEGWVPKNWCFWTVVLELTLESPLDSKEIKPVNPKGNQPWTFIGKTDAEDEAPILWRPDANSWLTGKDPDAGKDWWQEGKRVTEDEMVGWHHWLDRHEFEQTPGDSESPVLKGRPSAMLSLGRSSDAEMTQTCVQNDPNVSSLQCVSNSGNTSQ